MKNIIYRVLRYTGVFWFFGFFFRDRLLILCYHGISVRDEHRWWPGVFMRESVFRNRLKLLKCYGYEVLGLEEALEALDKNKLPPKSIVITADDGYLNSPQTLWKACASFGYPLTIYVTSYYSEMRNPVFNVMIHYLFWRTEKSSLTGNLALLGITGQEVVYLDQKNKAYWEKVIIDYGRKYCNEDERGALLNHLCELMEVDYKALKDEGMFMLMDDRSIAELAEEGVDIQLHTHRHHFPVEREAVVKELEDNRRFLEPLAGKRLEHFCYPSGIWDSRQHPWMKDLGIRSATTCQLGFVTASSDKLALNRYLDKDDITESEFLAEISGFLMFARNIRKKVKRLWN